MVPLVNPHADCSVDKLKAIWLRHAFGGSGRLLRVYVKVRYAPDQR